MTSCRLLTSLGLFFAAAALAQTSLPRAGTRTPDGHPDFQGVWNIATLTPLERGIAFGVNNKRISLPPITTLTIPDNEAKAYEERLRTGADFKPGDKSEADLSGEKNPVFFEFASELARVSGAKRTSLIVDPDNGRIPYIATEEQRKTSRTPERFDSVKDLSLTERCLHLFLTGPPIMASVTYYHGHQIVQTPDYVVIMAEYLHEARIVRIGGRHLSLGVRQWLGDSIGRWEGDTLVVDTTNFNTETKFMGASESLHVVERFKPIDGNTFLYRATVEDPSVFSKPWVFEYPFARTPGPLYEYACHEGNYALTNILKGARKSEADKAKQ